MSKAILVIDMPRCCKECPLIIFYGHGFCAKELRECSGKDKHVRKPDWCPLRPMPEKAEKRKTDNVHDIIIKQGWNACIDELTDGSSEEG